MALVPNDLLEQIAELEKLFIVSTEKLITISDKFVAELDKGKEPGLRRADGRFVKERRKYCMPS